MPYELTFSIMVLAALSCLGCFAIKCQTTEWQKLAGCAGTAEGFAKTRPLHFDMHVPHRRTPVFCTQGFDGGIEYHFHSKAGLLTIAPHRELPSAVELRIGGKILASYMSAEFAAKAVAAGMTNHQELDVLPSKDRPVNLANWEQSRPHHFKT